MGHVGDPRRWPDFDRQLAMEMAALFGLLLLCLYVVYFSTQAVARAYFLVLLCIFVFSKKDYFWFAFFFIIIAQPGWLFSDFSISSTTRIPVYTLLPSTSLTPMDLFSLLALIKALTRRKKYRLRLGRPLLYLLAYGVFLILLSIGIYGSDINVLANMLRSTFMYSVLLAFLILVDDREKAFRFMHLVFPLVFFILFTQVYFVVSGDEFVNVLSFGQRQLAYTETGMLRPVVGGIVVVLFSLTFALYLLQFKSGNIASGYLYVVVACSTLSVFISATRVWVIMFSFVLLCYVLFIKKRFVGILPIASVVGILMILIANVTPLRERMVDSWIRVSRVSSVAQGRFYRDTSFDERFTVRLPRVLDGLRQNWLLGWGFSDPYVRYNDGHVGNFNMLLQTGIAGFIVFLYFWYSYLKMIFNTAFRSAVPAGEKRALLVLASVFAAMLIGHFSTYQFFGYTGSESGIFFISIFVAISELAVVRARYTNSVPRTTAGSCAV